MTPEAMLEWLRFHGGVADFKKLKSVKLTAHGLTRSRPTLQEAIEALEADRSKKPNESICKTCKRLVLWRTNAQGQRISVDPDPVDAIKDELGDLTLLLKNGSSQKARKPRGNEFPDVRAHVVHWKSTCTDASQYHEEKLSEKVTQ